MVQCNECGTVYPETMRECPNCGSTEKIQLPPGSEFEERKPQPVWTPPTPPVPPRPMVQGKMNGYAIAGFVLSCASIVLMCVLPPLSVLGIVFSLMGLSQIRKTAQRGKGLAIAGLTMSIFTALGSIFLYTSVLLDMFFGG